MKRLLLSTLTFVVLALGCSLSGATPSDTQAPLFVPAPGSPVPVGEGSGEIVLADLNRDGQLDLLTKHLLGKYVAVQLGNGKGHFVPLAEGPIRFSFQPGAITLGDVNNDNLLDLGVARRDDYQEYVHIFLGNGRGSFTQVATSPVTVSASIKTYKPSLHFVDINADGKLDLVIANGRRNSIEFLMGDGRGGFSAASSMKLEAGQDRYTFALGDVDKDGHLDLAIASSVEANSVPGRVEIKRGDGQGTFTDAPALSVSVPPGPYVRTLADLNGDQQLDLLLSHGRSNHLSLLLNHGQGKFKPAPASPYNVGAEAFAVVVIDVNGDQRKDLVAATVNSITVLLGNGREFARAPGSPFRAGPGAYNVTVGDLNQDGQLDIAASSFEGNGVTLLLRR